MPTATANCKFLFTGAMWKCTSQSQPREDKATTPHRVSAPQNKRELTHLGHGHPMMMMMMLTMSVRFLINNTTPPAGGVCFSPQRPKTRRNRQNLAAKSMKLKTNQWTLWWCIFDKLWKCSAQTTANWRLWPHPLPTPTIFPTSGHTYICY